MKAKQDRLEAARNKTNPMVMSFQNLNEGRNDNLNCTIANGSTSEEDVPGPGPQVQGPGQLNSQLNSQTVINMVSEDA